MKRTLSFILTIIICLTLLPGTSRAAVVDDIESYATFLTGSGTSDDPYLIYDEKDLNEFRDLVNNGATSACARLEKDIVLNDGEFSWDENNDPLYNGKSVTDGDVAEWTPIGIPKNIMDFSSGWYQGTFDGNGHVISGLFCDYPESVSFFGMTAGGLFCALGASGTVKNVGVVNSYIRGIGASSIVVGCQGDITGCFSDAFVCGLPLTANGLSCAGGIVAVTVSGDIKNNLYTGTVKGVSGAMGGIVGLHGLTEPLEYVSTAKYGSNYFIKTSGKYILGNNSVTEAKLLSGEIAYKLNVNLLKSDGIEPFGQTVGVNYPAFGGDYVYKIKSCNGKAAYSNVDQDLEHNFDENYKCLNCGDYPEIVGIIDGNERIYDDGVQAFADAAGKSAVLKMYQDIELDDPLVLSSGDITVNLRGFELATEEEVAIQLDGATLTIQDTSAGSEGYIYSYCEKTDGLEGAVTMSSGKLKVTGGTIGADNSFSLVATGGTVEISDGEFIGDRWDHTVQLPVNTVLTGGRFEGLSVDGNLRQAVPEGYAVQFVETKNWDTEMRKSLYTDEVQIKAIPFKITEKPSGIGAVEGYTKDEVAALQVKAKGTGITYQWYEVKSDGTAEEIAGATESTFEIPVGKTAGTYWYRWRVEADGYWETGEVSFKVVARSEEDPEEPSTEPTPGPTEPPVIPSAPEIEEDLVVNISDPVIGNGVAGKKIEDQYIFLDVDPLQGITLKTLRENLSNPEMSEYGDVNYDIQGNKEEDDRIKTSDRLEISVCDANGDVLATRTYILVVMGDTNCDGMALSSDALLMMRIYSDTQTVSDEVRLAADMDQNGILGANDARRLIYKYYNWGGNYETKLG